jgi:hypothetical protein
VTNPLDLARNTAVARGDRKYITGTSAAPRPRVTRVGILVGGLLAYLVANAGCYNPQLRDCAVQCSAPTDCTGGQVCRADGFCSMAGAAECSNVDGEMPDGNTANDASTNPDALSLCQLGCSNGTCVAGVCVIDCSATGSCPNDVICPANLPCRVVCGDQACGHKVNCGMSTSCHVQCMGTSSCQDEIQCNANRCDVDCTGPSSCKRRTKCANACACDVSCTGTGSCAEPSECPESTCRIGNGCTSLLAGCDSC